MSKLFRKFGLSLSLVFIAVIVILVGTILIVVINKTNSFFNQLMTTQSATANEVFVSSLEAYQAEALARAEMIGASTTIIEAVENGDEQQLRKELAILGVGMDLITLCDAEGTVLARSHSDKTGDSVLSQKAISVALSSGSGISTIEPGTVIGLSTRGSAAIKDSSGKIIGALTCGHDLSQPKYVDEIKAENNCEVTFFAGKERMNTTIVDESGQRVIGTEANEDVADLVLNQKQSFQNQLELFGKMYQGCYSPLIVDGQAIGMLFTGVQIEDFLAQSSLLRTLTLVALLSLLMAVVCVALIIRWVAKKMYWYEGILDSIPSPLSVTDMNMKWTFVNRPVEQMLNVKRGDIVGKHCSTWGAAICNTANCGINCLRNNKDTTFFEQWGMDFQVNIAYLTDKHNKNVGHIEMVQDISQTMAAQKKQTEMVLKIQEVSKAFVTSSQQIANGAQSLAQGSTQQSAAVEEISSSISEVTGITKENAAMAEKAAKLGASIKENAEKGSQQMARMTNAVREINEASQSINKVIKVIDDIAFQTNILALNAAVEAARAGQHGKGFAVVAEEVRNLASKSAEAAKDTGSLIVNSIEKAELGALIADETAASLEEIVTGVGESDRIIDEIARLSRKQEIAISEVNSSVDQVAQVVQQNSATAQQSAAASQEMGNQSLILQELLDSFCEETKLNKEAAGLLHPGDSEGRY